jgi:hypothetical protein
VTGAVHASIGAGVGSFFKSKAAAFAAGMLSHLVADALPHKDLPPAVEVPLLLGALGGVAAWKGLDSPEFWGALGAVAPDFEHALLVAGIIGIEHEVFPTHIGDGKWHGAENDERWSQLILAVAALGTVALNTKDRGTDQ